MPFQIQSYFSIILVSTFFSNDLILSDLWWSSRYCV